MIGALDGGQAWLRRFRQPGVPPRLRLVCLPHAGGGASAFRSWPHLLPEDVDMLAVCYPGRQDRFREPCVERMDVMADLVTEALLPYAGEPLAVFGHSMGASIAYEVAVRMEQRHGRRLAALFVSGQAPPHRARYRDAHLRGDDALIADVRWLGGSGADAPAHPDLIELVLPALRADYALLAGYRRDPLYVLGTPVVAYAGRDDGEVSPDALARWADVTEAGLTVRMFPGDHFYLVDAEAELVADVSDRLGAFRNTGAGRDRP
ncbi:MAG TPA: alpha/beta fold hydrolase [Pilimelia sp.]|nr:alpha/beta fold hydrolase [Pilimelia sp.]